MSQGPEKGAVSAQKALRGSETEMRELLGGMEENSVSPMRVIDLPSRQISEHGLHLLSFKLSELVKGSTYMGR